jgi:hypothetical protein
MNLTFSTTTTTKKEMIEYTNNKVFDFSIVFFYFKTTKEKNT